MHVVEAKNLLDLKNPVNTQNLRFIDLLKVVKLKGFAAKGITSYFVRVFSLSLTVLSESYVIEIQMSCMCPVTLGEEGVGSRMHHGIGNMIGYPYHRPLVIPYHPLIYPAPSGIP